MEANELRIGNTIYTLGQSHNEKGEFTGWVNYEIKVDLEVLQNILTENTDFKYSAIPLNEECLMKFGFQKEWSRFEIQAEIFAFVLDDIYLHFIDGECWFCDEYDGNLSKGRKLKGVHYLQNLFFALKGKELTLK